MFDSVTSFTFGDFVADPLIQRQFDLKRGWNYLNFNRRMMWDVKVILNAAKWIRIGNQQKKTKNKRD